VFRIAGVENLVRDARESSLPESGWDPHGIEVSKRAAFEAFLAFPLEILLEIEVALQLMVTAW
jgi:hypothetical protein